MASLCEMYRFVDLTDAYWTDPEHGSPLCAILDTRTDKFFESNGSHVLHDLDEVREAAGERGARLVPAGFFERQSQRQSRIADIAELGAP